MSIQVIKEGNLLKVIESSAPIPDGVKLTLYTAAELKETCKQPTAWEAAQLESVFHEDDEDWGSSLDSMVVREEGK